jgi:hypothetical protein
VQPGGREIANISSIVRQPNSEMVEVRYNQVVPQQMEGSLDDPKIRELLMLASENSASPVCGTTRWACWRPSAGGAQLPGGGHSRCADGGAALRQECGRAAEGAGWPGALRGRGCGCAMRCWRRC